MIPPHKNHARACRPLLADLVWVGAVLLGKFVNISDEDFLRTRINRDSQILRCWWEGGLPPRGGGGLWAVDIFFYVFSFATFLCV